MSLTSKERVLTALKHVKPDRPPFNFWMDRRLMRQYEERIGHRHWRVTRFGADVIETFTGLKFPKAPSVERDGTRWAIKPYFESWDSPDSVPLPDPNDPAVFELMQADIREFPGHAVLLDLPTPWGVIASMRTYEFVYTDMYDYPDAFKRLARRILDVQKAAVERACGIGITALYLMEDLATTRGLSFSPAMINEFCLVFARELAGVAHEHGIPVLFHSDGDTSQLVELLLPLGISAINPLQPHLNNAAEFKRRFGDRLAVYGALDNCYIIPNGTPGEIRKHVLDVFETLGKPDGGLIFSTHDIPLGTPDENVTTMVHTVTQDCRY